MAAHLLPLGGNHAGSSGLRRSPVPHAAPLVQDPDAPGGSHRRSSRQRGEGLHSAGQGCALSLRRVQLGEHEVASPPQEDRTAQRGEAGTLRPQGDHREKDRPRGQVPLVRGGEQLVASRLHAGAGRHPRIWGVRVEGHRIEHRTHCSTAHLQRPRNPQAVGRIWYYPPGGVAGRRDLLRARRSWGLPSDPPAQPPGPPGGTAQRHAGHQPLGSGTAARRRHRLRRGREEATHRRRSRLNGRARLRTGPGGA